MRAAGTFFVVIAAALFAGSIFSVIGFLAGGFEFIDDGEPAAIMVYVPVGLALGFVGLLSYIAGSALRKKPAMKAV